MYTKEEAVSLSEITTLLAEVDETMNEETTSFMDNRFTKAVIQLREAMGKDAEGNYYLSVADARRIALALPML